MVGVFKMNDCDWVKADTEEQAKVFYMKETGFDREEVDEYFYGEVPLTDVMHLLEIDVPELDLNMYNFTKRKLYGQDVYEVPFWWVILQAGTGEPYIIASTEY